MLDLRRLRLLRELHARGTIAAGACVIACGPMSGAVARLAGVELPIETYLRHKVVLPDEPQGPPWAPPVVAPEMLFGARFPPGQNPAMTAL